MENSFTFFCKLYYRFWGPEKLSSRYCEAEEVNENNGLYLTQQSPNITFCICYTFYHETREHWARATKENTEWFKLLIVFQEPFFFH